MTYTAWPGWNLFKWTDMTEHSCALSGVREMMPSSSVGSSTAVLVILVMVMK